MMRDLSGSNGSAGIVFVVAFAILALLYPLPASAADIAVGGSCSLADAITAANTDTATGGCSAGSGADTISLSGSITLSTALPQITTALTINGNGHTLDGGGGHRIIDIATAFNSDGNAAASRIFAINNLTLRNGYSSEGGAIRVHGARADNLASLTLSNTNVYSSRSTANGGGIHAKNAVLNVQSQSLLSGNNSTNNGGGIHADHSTVNITGSSSLIGNSGGVYGGSVYAIDTHLNINHAAISDSTAGENGGGIAYFYRHSITISNAVISGNGAGNNGGGIYANITSGTSSLTNSSLFSNTSGRGGDNCRIDGSSINADANSEC